MSGTFATRLAVIAFALLVGGCDLPGEQMQRGRVLDQDTGEPIAGAIVLGRYMGGISWGGSSCNRAESAVSDAQGWFELPVDRKDGTPLMEAYKRGYDRGNPVRYAFLNNAWTREWRISVQKWNDSNTLSTQTGIEPEIYRTEASAKAASGEDVNVHLRISRGTREERLRQLRLFQDDCAGRPRTTVGLVPFIEGILSEQRELGEREDVLDITRSRLERARDHKSPTARRAT
jgi:hypothetical protein